MLRKIFDLKQQFHWLWSNCRTLQNSKWNKRCVVWRAFLSGLCQFYKRILWDFLLIVWRQFTNLFKSFVQNSVKIFLNKSSDGSKHCLMIKWRSSLLCSRGFIRTSWRAIYFTFRPSQDRRTGSLIKYFERIAKVRRWDR